MSRPDRTRALPLLLCLVLSPSMLAAQEQSTLERESQETLTPQRERELELEVETAPVDKPPETHATREAPAELIGQASREPERFIGRTLVLTDGAERRNVGPVLAVRQRREDQRVYFIVDATEYFNSATQYAVAVGDVARLEGDTLVTPAAPGMHLLGLDYYAEDYEDLAEPAPLTDE